MRRQPEQGYIDQYADHQVEGRAHRPQRAEGRAADQHAQRSDQQHAHPFAGSAGQRAQQPAEQRPAEQPGPAQRPGTQQHSGQRSVDEGDQQRPGFRRQLPQRDFRRTRRRGRRQRFAVDQADQLVHRGLDPAGVVTLAKCRGHPLANDPSGDHIGHRTLQAVADLDAHAPVILGHHQQQTVVDRLAAELPGLEQLVGEGFDIEGTGSRQHHQRDLRAASPLQRLELLHQALARRLVQRVGGIHHPLRQGKATHSAGASACTAIQGSSQARASNRRTGGKIRSDRVRSMNGKALIPSGYRPRLPQRGAQLQPGHSSRRRSGGIGRSFNGLGRLPLPAWYCLSW